MKEEDGERQKSLFQVIIIPEGNFDYDAVTSCSQSKAVISFILLQKTGASRVDKISYFSAAGVVFNWI